MSGIVYETDQETGEEWKESASIKAAEIRPAEPGMPSVEEQIKGDAVCWSIGTVHGYLTTTTSVKLARRLAQFILDHTEDGKRVSDGLSDPGPSPSEGKPVKHTDGAKEEQTTATEEEA